MSRTGGVGPSFPINLIYSGNDTWDTTWQQGVHLLEPFVQDGRVSIPSPTTQQQIQFTRTLRSGSGFVAYIDAVGQLDGSPCVLEWKTTSARYTEELAGIVALDPQLICYSWITGIETVARQALCRSAIPPSDYYRQTAQRLRSLGRRCCPED